MCRKARRWAKLVPLLTAKKIIEIHRDATTLKPLLTAKTTPENTVNNSQKPFLYEIQGKHEWY